MKHILIRLGLATVLAILQPVHAAIYYVDPGAGNDTRNGLTKATAWKRCPGDAVAQNVAAATSLVGGDTVIFNNDVTYPTPPIKLRWSGSSGKPITYDGKSWGSKKASQIFGNYKGNIDGFSTDGQARNWLVFRGFYITGMGGYPDSHPIWSGTALISSGPNGRGIGFSNGGNDLLFEDIYVDRCGMYQNHKLMAFGDVIQGIGFDMVNVNRVTFRRCQASRMRMGISLKANSSGNLSDILIDQCEMFTNLTWCIDISPRANDRTIRNITIRRSSFHDYAQFDLGNWIGKGEKPHRDGIFLRVGSYTGTTWDGILIDSCFFYANNTSGGIGGTACINSSEGASMTVANCVFLNDPQGDALVKATFANKGRRRIINIFNNTFYTGYRPLRLGPSTRNTSYGQEPDIFRVYNNIFYRINAAKSYTAFIGKTLSTASMLWENNIVYSTYAPLSGWNAYHIEETGYKTLAMWKSMGWGLKDRWSDPLFVKVSGLPSTYDLRLKPGSPAINAGINLSSYFTTDYTGAKRPATGAWDIGAFEFGPGSILPGSPNNLRARQP